MWTTSPSKVKAVAAAIALLFVSSAQAQQPGTAGGAPQAFEEKPRLRYSEAGLSAAADSTPAPVQSAVPSNGAPAAGAAPPKLEGAAAASAQTMVQAGQAAPAAVAAPVAKPEGSTAAAREAKAEPSADKKAAARKTRAPKKPSVAKPADSADSQPPQRFEAPRPDEIVVSDRDFNRFVFPSPVVGIHFPAGAPIRGEPKYLAGNHQFLLSLAKGAEKPIQMIIELESGEIITRYLKPRPIDGIVHRIANARDVPAPRKAGNATDAQEEAANAGDIRLLERIVRGDIPEGFQPVELTPPTRFDRFTVIPLAFWSDRVSRTVKKYQLVAQPGMTSTVAPSQFYRPGVTAVIVDGSQVDQKNSPELFIVEELAADE